MTESPAYSKMIIICCSDNCTWFCRMFDNFTVAWLLYFLCIKPWLQGVYQHPGYALRLTVIESFFPCPIYGLVDISDAQIRLNCLEKLMHNLQNLYRESQTPIRNRSHPCKKGRNLGQVIWYEEMSGWPHSNKITFIESKTFDTPSTREGDTAYNTTNAFHTILCICMVWNALAVLYAVSPSVFWPQIPQ